MGSEIGCHQSTFFAKWSRYERVGWLLSLEDAAFCEDGWVLLKLMVKLMVGDLLLSNFVSTLVAALQPDPAGD